MTSVTLLQHPLESRRYYYSLDTMSSQSTPSVAMRRIPSQPDYSSEDSKRQSTPGAKRRPSKAGKRSVTTLTAAQLERKRANDREAQRAIRQRTKDHIDQLERQIADLTSNQDNSSKLVEVLRRNDELESENAMLKSRLNHAFSALGYTESGAYHLQESRLSCFFAHTVPFRATANSSHSCDRRSFTR